ncbi:MAG: hypothetical protein ACYTAO_11350 [Planctomycetota bacterium]|jgi:hypothetical protein
MSKGSQRRPCNKARFDAEYDRVFGAKRLNVWEDAPPKEESPEEVAEKSAELDAILEGTNQKIGELPNGIQGGAGDGARDRADSGSVHDVPQEPGGRVDSQAAGPVASPTLRNCSPAPGKHPFDTDYWTYSGYRGEFNCPHGVGHGNHVHGCCQEHCCTRPDFPLLEVAPCPHCKSVEYTPGGEYCDVCGGTF